MAMAPTTFKNQNIDNNSLVIQFAAKKEKKNAHNL